MMTPKGTKPNAQHRETVGRYATYAEALAALEADERGIGVVRKNTHFAIRREVKK